jgi:cytochrome P450
MAQMLHWYTPAILHVAGHRTADGTIPWALWWLLWLERAVVQAQDRVGAIYSTALGADLAMGSARARELFLRDCEAAEAE